MAEGEIPEEWRRELDESIERLEFVDRLSEGVVVFDNSGTSLYCNVAAASIVDREVSEIIGQSLTTTDMSFFHEDGSPIAAEDHPVTRTLVTGQGVSSVVVGIDLPGMSRKFVSASTTPILQGDDVVGLVATLDDISVRIKGERQLRLLLEVSRLLTSVGQESDFLQGVCDVLVDVGGYAMARLSEPSLLDPLRVTTIFAAGGATTLDGRPVSWADIDQLEVNHAGQVLWGGETVVIGEFPSALSSPSWNAFAATCDIASCVVMPLQVTGRHIALVLYDRYGDSFDEVTVKRLEEIAREIEFGIHYVASARQLAESLKGTVSALSHMTETRDPYTSGHQSRVGELSELIARRLGLDDTMSELIRQSGELHDVGKISIPSEILTFPGRLTPLQFELVKGHTVVGFEILSRASLPWPIAEVALRHHERLDGSGYPDGLSADEISLPARIVAVADVVEAMSQHRPYRPGLGIERALAEVRDSAGTLFDIDVVAACAAIFAEGYSFIRDA